MQLAQPVTHPRQDDVIVLERGYVLNDEVIERMRDAGVPPVWIVFPRLEIPDDRIRERVQERHAELFVAMQDTLDRVRHRVAVEMNYGLYRRSVEGLLFEMMVDHENEEAVAQLSESAPDLAGHMANVAYISLLLGLHLPAYLRSQRRNLPAHVAEDTRRLGLGALLHDIGKIDIDPALRDCTVFDPEAESEEYRAHTLAGYENVLGRVPGAAATIVLNHHQRFNGGGFPDRFNRLTKATRDPPSAEAIHIYSRVVAVADAFDHLLTRDGKVVPTVIALHAVRGWRLEGWFDPVIVDALIQLAPPFPAGAVVRLSDRTDAVVVANDCRSPCQPQVKRIYGPVTDRGRHAATGIIDLRRRPDIHIETIEGHDVAPYLFDLTEEFAQVV